MAELQTQEQETATGDFFPLPDSKLPKRERRTLTGKKLNIKQFLQISHTDISDKISPELRLALGQIEYGFDMFIFGGSGDGKSSFSARVTKELSQFGKVLHLLYEEGHSKSARLNLQRSEIAQMALNNELPHGYDLLDNCSFDELIRILTAKKSPKVIIIDSFQYARFTKHQWLEIKNRFVKGRNKKFFIVISHADGKKPRGSVAIDALYDAQIKVYIKNMIAFIKSRYEGKGNFVIWEEGAKMKWGKKYKKMLTEVIF